MTENAIEILPSFFLTALQTQYGEAVTERILQGISAQRQTSFRVNTLKADVPAVLEEVTAAGLQVTPVKWSDTAFLVQNGTETALQALPCYAEGKLYLQSLSSMLPPVILQPQKGMEILDMTAAPGGKTTQMAAMTQNQANIMACELHNVRAEKLKYNLEKQGAKRVNVMVTDARRLDSFFSFDRILLDAPCTGSGTLQLQDAAALRGFTEVLLQKTRKAQAALLKKACQLLKKGQEMVYSTCSILAEENEMQVQTALQKYGMELVPIVLEGVEELPLLPTQLEGTLCVCPDAAYEGFFVAKLRKKK